MTILLIWISLDFNKILPDWFGRNCYKAMGIRISNKWNPISHLGNIFWCLIYKTTFSHWVQLCIHTITWVSWISLTLFLLGISILFTKMFYIFEQTIWLVYGSNFKGNFANFLLSTIFSIPSLQYCISCREFYDLHNRYINSAQAWVLSNKIYVKL